MNEGVLRQKDFWDKEVDAFDAIYSHKKNKFGILLDSIFRWDMYKRFDYTMENAQPIENRAFLDVGCGTGQYSLELARRNARMITGIDISEKMIEVCRQRAAKKKLDNICSFIQTDLLKYQPSATFDVCIGIGLFDYIKEPLPVLAKMRECARSKVVISFPRLWTWRAIVRKVRLLINQCDVYFYSRAHIDRLLKTAGFKRYSIQKIGQLYCVSAFPE